MILGAGSIALISLAAVLTLRGFPSVAEYGWSSIAFYLMGTLFFFLPLALVAAELATGWPRAGGLYAWVKQAFGDRSGFLAVWFEWVENIVWFPTVLSFVAATLAYVIDPSLASDKLYLVIAMLTIFWGLTLANFFGMKWTARLNNPGVIAGTLLLVGVHQLAGRVSAAMVVPYPPGIPVIMPGERFPHVDSALIRYLATSQGLDARFPAFETEIHGIDVQPDGSYRVPCLVD